MINNNISGESSNKRRRYDENQSNDSSVSNILNEYPYIHRGIQASDWMKHNPLILQHGLLKNEIFNLCSTYIFDLFKRFYSGCGLSYNPREQEVFEERIEILIETPINENFIEMHFSIFLSFLQANLMNAFYISKYDWNSISCRTEGTFIWVSIYPTLDDQSGCLKYYDGNMKEVYKIPDSNIPI